MKIATWIVALAMCVVAATVVWMMPVLASHDVPRRVYLKDSPCFEDEYLSMVAMNFGRKQLDIYECRSADEIKKRYR